MELERSRKMELLYTPKSELAKMMKENSVSIDDLMFLFASNKVTPPEIRMSAPLLCDKLLGMLLKQWLGTETGNSMVMPAPREDKPVTAERIIRSSPVERRVAGVPVEAASQVVA